MRWYAMPRPSKETLARVLIRLMLLGLAGSGALALTLLAAVLDPDPIVIESLESKTVEGHPVFNRIQWLPGWEEDRWLMQQSHGGPDLATGKWDRIGIAVTKGEASEVTYFQWKSGPMAWPEESERVRLKATCFHCHPNGPRAIRPNRTSGKAPMSWWTSLRVVVWNLRIKSYGRILPSPENSDSFRSEGRLANETLKVPTCLKCHREDGLFARGRLTRQNYMTIGFMVENGFMPPMGFELSEMERRDIHRFIGKRAATSEKTVFSE